MLKVVAPLVTALILNLINPLSASLATTSNDIALGTTANFSVVSGGVIVLGASAQFTGASPVQVALVAAVDLDSPTVSAYTAAGVNNFIQNTDTATIALSDARTLLAQLDSLTGITRSPVLGNETISAGVYDALSGTAISITTPLVLDGGGDYNSIFVFRTPAAFDVDANLTIHMVNGAQAANIFWVAAGAITIGANTTIPGNFISPAAINVGADDLITGSLIGTTAAAITIGARAVIAHSSRPTLASWANVSKVYGDAPFSAMAPIVNESIPGSFSYTSETPSVISISGNTFSIVDVGSSQITATFNPTNSALYYPESTTMVITVGKGNQIITWAPAISLLTTATPYTPSNLASSLDSATVSYEATSVGTTGCLVDSATAVLTFSAAGSCIVAVTAAQTSRYESATVIFTFVITIPTPTPEPVTPPAPIYVEPLTPTPTPSPTPSPSPLPTPTPSPTPSPSPLPTPTPSPLPSPTVAAPIAIKPPERRPKPRPLITAKPLPLATLPAEIFAVVEISPIRVSPGALTASIHISLRNMAAGQEITITLKDLSK